MQNADPISYLDENGKLQGITVKILDKIAEHSNLVFKPSSEIIEIKSDDEN